MMNRVPKTRLTSAVLAVALLHGSVVASATTVCSCRDGRTQRVPGGGCCCSRPESGRRSCCGCCRNSLKDDDPTAAGCCSVKSSTLKRRSCCEDRPSASGDSICRSCGCSCGYRSVSVPACVPARPGSWAENLMLDPAGAVSVVAVIQRTAPRPGGDASVESDAVTALARCCGLCRFTL